MCDVVGPHMCAPRTSHHQKSRLRISDMEGYEVMCAHA